MERAVIEAAAMEAESMAGWYWRRMVAAAAMAVAAMDGGRRAASSVRRARHVQVRLESRDTGMRASESTHRWG